MSFRNSLYLSRKLFRYVLVSILPILGLLWFQGFVSSEPLYVDSQISDSIEFSFLSDVPNDILQTQAITLPTYLSQMHYNSTKGLLYVSDESSTLYIIDGMDIHKTSIGINRGTSFATSSDSGYTYVTSGEPFEKRVDIFDGAILLKTIEFSRQRSHAYPLYNPVDGKIYIHLTSCCENEAVVVMSGMETERTIELPGRGFSDPNIVVNPVNGFLYGASYHGRQVVAFDSSGVVNSANTFNPAPSNVRFHPEYTTINLNNGLVYVYGPVIESRPNNTRPRLHSALSVFTEPQLISSNTLETKPGTYICGVFPQSTTNYLYVWQGDCGFSAAPARFNELIVIDEIMPVDSQPLSMGVSNVIVNPVSGLLYMVESDGSGSSSLYTYDYDGGLSKQDVDIKLDGIIRLVSSQGSSKIAVIDSTKSSCNTKITIIDGTTAGTSEKLSVSIPLFQYLNVFFTDDALYVGGLSCGDGSVIYRIPANSLREYQVSGRVKDDDTPVEGVTISDGAEYSTTTDSDGYYTLTGLTAGTYKLRATMQDYLFFHQEVVNDSMLNSPVLEVVVDSDAIEQDFVAVPCTSPTQLPVCQLQKGDILLETATLIQGQIKAGFLGTYWYHTALYDGEGNVLEAFGELPPEQQSQEVRASPIHKTDFYIEATDLTVLRLKSQHQSKVDGAVDWAERKATIDDDARFISLKDIFLFPTLKSQDTVFYCSLFVWRAYKEQQLDIDTDTLLLDLLRRELGTPLSELLHAQVLPDDIYASTLPIVSDRNIEVVWDKNPDFLRALYILLSPADLRVIDSEGNVTGVNPDTGEIINNIPGAYYSGPDSEPEWIAIPNMVGDSRVEIYGTDVGTYTFGVQVFAEGVMNDIVQHNTQKGQVDIFKISDPSQGSVVIQDGQLDSRIYLPNVNLGK